MIRIKIDSNIYEVSESNTLNVSTLLELHICLTVSHLLEKRLV
jgi:hypothetical protein